jgi:hypothetical protein
MRQINKQEYDERYVAAKERWETPVSQQGIDSHVAAPILIAFIFTVVVTFMTAAIMQKIGRFDWFVLAMVFGLAFLVMFLKRIGVADKLLWKFEEATGIDLPGVEDPGIKPRAVPLTTSKGTSQLALNDSSDTTVTPRDWSRAAVSLLNEQQAVSRRGLSSDKAKKKPLSQAKAQAVANALHESNRAKDGKLNGVGWDWVFSYLPDNVQCLMERPIDPPTPGHSGAGWLEAASTNQPTNQPGGTHGS